MVATGLQMSLGLLVSDVEVSDTGISGSSLRYPQRVVQLWHLLDLWAAERPLPSGRVQGDAKSLVLPSDRQAFQDVHVQCQ